MDVLKPMKVITKSGRRTDYSLFKAHILTYLQQLLAFSLSNLL
jgi:hypothetical protein